MHSPRLQRYWFAALWLLFPWPLLVLQDAFVPAARYVLLGGVAAIVAIAEGAAGPVGLLVLLFLGWGALTSLLCWLLAWSIARLLDHVPETTANMATIAILVLGLLWALFLEPYSTPFGRALRGGLLEVLS